MSIGLRPWGLPLVTTLKKARGSPCCCRFTVGPGYDFRPGKRRGHRSGFDQRSAATTTTNSGGSEVRTFSKVTDSKLTESYLGELFEGFASASEDEVFGDLRQILYPEKTVASKDDPEIDTLFRLSYAGSVQDVLNILQSCSDSATHLHTAQALATLLYLQKLATCFYDPKYFEDGRFARCEFAKQLREQPLFQDLLSKARHHLPLYDLETAAYLFQGLRRLELLMSDDIMVDFTVHLRRRMADMDLKSLSLFSVGVRGRYHNEETGLKAGSLMWILTMAPALPHLSRMIEQDLKSPNDVRRAAVILNSLAPLVSNEILTKFNARVSGLLDDGAFKDSKDPVVLSALVKVLCLKITKKDWYQSRPDILVRISEQLRGKVQHLRPSQVVLVAKVVVDVGGPAALIHELDEVCCRYLDLHCHHDLEAKAVFEAEPRGELSLSSKEPGSGDENKDQSDLYLGMNIPLVDFYHVKLMLNPNSVNSEHLRNLVRRILKADRLLPMFMSQMSSILKTHYMGSEDAAFVEEYFMKAFEICRGDLKDLARLAHKYSSFSSHVRKSFEVEQFERQMIDVFLEDALNTVHPSMFAIEYGFILSHSIEIPESLLDRFKSLVCQMNAGALFCVSRGLETRFHWVPKTRAKPPLDGGSLVSTFNSSFDIRSSPSDPVKSTSSILQETEILINRRCLELMETVSGGGSETRSPLLHHHESEETDGFIDAYYILRSLISRKLNVDNHTLLEAMKRLSSSFSADKLSFPIIRQLASALSSSRVQYSVDDLVREMVAFSLSHRSMVHVSSLVRLLHLAHRLNLSYLRDTNQGRAFLEVCSYCLLRDFDSLIGLNVLRMATILASHRMLGRQLIGKIFSEDFMDRIDKEMSETAFNSPYPRTVRHQMMLLNRAVCINSPQSQVPWFHEKFCQENIHSLKAREGNEELRDFKEDVYQVLSEVVGGIKYVQENVFSKYYHLIDLHIQRDQRLASSNHLGFMPLGDLGTGLDRRFSSMRKVDVGDSFSKSVIESYAILVLGKEDLVANTDRMVGNVADKAQELRTLGFKVLTVSQPSWNQMAMSSEVARTKFFCEQFGIARTANKKAVL